MRSFAILSLLVFTGCTLGGDTAPDVPAPPVKEVAPTDGSAEVGLAIVYLEGRLAPAPKPPQKPGEPCENCGGDGDIGDGTIVKKCPVCEGTGKIPFPKAPPVVSPDLPKDALRKGINDVRVSAGLRELPENDMLNRAAEVCAQLAKIGGRPPLMEDVKTARLNYGYTSSVYPITAVGKANPKEALVSLMGNSDCRAAIMAEDAVEIGCGVYSGSWSALLGRDLSDQEDPPLSTRKRRR